MNDIASNNSTSPDFFSNAFLMGNIGAPFLIGLAVGYFAKKMLLMALFIGGGIVTALFAAEYYGVININGEVLQDAASSAALAAKHSGGFLIDRLSTISARGVSGVGGFYVGFKLG
jgi:uncharacterized membrane protein (Fun14 family)